MARWHLGSAVAILLFWQMALSELTQLNKKNFKDIVGGTELLVVSFCVSWYEPCKVLMPELETASEKLSNKNIYLTTIDCAEDVELCSSYNVHSYPTIRIFRGLERTPTRYRGKQNAKAIVSHVIKQVLDRISEINVENIAEFQELETPMLVAHFDKDDMKSSEIFFQLAESSLHHDFVFGTATDLSLFQVEETNRPFIVLWNPLDEVPAIYNGDFEIESIFRFAEEAISSPLIPQFSMQKFAEYAKTQLPLALIFALTQAERTVLSQALKRIAMREKGNMNFATVDAEKLAFLAEPLGLDGETWPAFVVHNIVDDKSFVFDQGKEITLQGIEEFVEEFWKIGEGKSERPKETAMRKTEHDEL